MVDLLVRSSQFLYYVDAPRLMIDKAAVQQTPIIVCSSNWCIDNFQIFKFAQIAI